MKVSRPRQYEEWTYLGVSVLARSTRLAPCPPSAALCVLLQYDFQFPSFSFLVCFLLPFLSHFPSSFASRPHICMFPVALHSMPPFASLQLILYVSYLVPGHLISRPVLPLPPPPLSTSSPAPPHLLVDHPVIHSPQSPCRSMPQCCNPCPEIHVRGMSHPQSRRLIRLAPHPPQIPFAPCPYTAAQPVNPAQPLFSILPRLRVVS